MFQSLAGFKRSCPTAAASAIPAREFANYLNCGATQPLTTRGTGCLRPVKNWRFFPPLSVERLSTPSVTEIKAKSPFQKQRDPGSRTQSSAVHSPRTPGEFATADVRSKLQRVKFTRLQGNLLAVPAEAAAFLRGSGSALGSCTSAIPRTKQNKTPKNKAEVR